MVSQGTYIHSTFRLTIYVHNVHNLVYDGVATFSHGRLLLLAKSVRMRASKRAQLTCSDISPWALGSKAWMDSGGIGSGRC